MRSVENNTGSEGEVFSCAGNIALMREVIQDGENGKKETLCFEPHTESILPVWPVRLFSLKETDAFPISYQPYTTEFLKKQMGYNIFVQLCIIILIYFLKMGRTKY